MNINIGILQILPNTSQDDNLKKGIDACRKAKAKGADIIVFPEMWNIGYEISQDPQELNKKSIDINSSFIESFKKLAKELDVAIAITYLEKHLPLPRNAVSLIDHNGKIVLQYAKVHTCDFGEERMLNHGDDFSVCNLATSKGNIMVGTMICYDREFPESARILMLKGAEIILVPNACPMEINRISQLRSRAFENMLGIVTVNYPSPKPDCNGHSTVFDGIAYKPNEENSRDTKIFEADEKEGIYVVNMPIDEIREYRKKEVHGNAYRQPDKYHIITEEKIEEPFVRSDYRK